MEFFIAGVVRGLMDRDLPLAFRAGEIVHPNVISIVSHALEHVELDGAEFAQMFADLWIVAQFSLNFRVHDIHAEVADAAAAQEDHHDPADNGAAERPGEAIGAAGFFPLFAITERRTINRHERESHRSGRANTAMIMPSPNRTRQHCTSNRTPGRLLNRAFHAFINSCGSVAAADYFVLQQLQSQVSQMHSPPSWQQSHPLTQAHFASAQQDVVPAATVAPVAASSASVLDADF